MIEENITPGAVNLDADGFINTDYYINAAIDIMNRAAEERGQNPRHINTNIMHSFDLRAAGGGAVNCSSVDAM